MRAWLRRGAAAAVGVVLVLGTGAGPARADGVRDRQWHLPALQVAEAHTISRGKGVIVAVPDTGVAADHPDLAGSILSGVDLMGDSTDGHVDTDGHGTAMIGLIAARGHGPGRAHGALGIAPEATVYPIRVGRGMYMPGDTLAPAIHDAVRAGATVISMSLSGGTDTALREAVQAAVDADVVLVAGVGNRPEAHRVGYPAAYPGVLAVGATQRDGRLGEVSVRGVEVDITAPGVDLVRPALDGYGRGTGTSGATAIVAGAAALIRSKYPHLSAVQVRDRLTSTATDKGPPGRDPQYGHGALDLLAALRPELTPKPTPQVWRTQEQWPPAEAAAPTDRPAALKLSGAAYTAMGCPLLVLALTGAVWLALRRRRLTRKDQQA
ncbi:S8 family serine peptidase [Plantactinospora sp. CA-290183]|uniref:S8 family serine peptidase n=1 Tax=Plantactinospora sp. CA-290183 TaxID=3240006 RepID=UPI003D94311E